MKNDKLNELSIEQLQAKKKTLKNAAIGMGIVMLIACSVLFYLSIKSKNFALITVAIACLLTLLPSFIGISQIKAEIKSRDSK